MKGVHEVPLLEPLPFNRLEGGSLAALCILVNILCTVWHCAPSLKSCHGQDTIFKAKEH